MGANLQWGADDGIYLTSVETGETRLLISIREAYVRTLPREELQEFDNWEVYGFHSKWNPQGTRIMFSLRRLNLMINLDRYKRGVIPTERE